MQNDFVQYLAEALQGSLPGIQAHRKLAPPGRALIVPENNELPTRESGVLLLLFPVKNRLFTCLIKRPFNMKHHPGQIGFPGGKVEKQDSDAQAAAMRETYEEVGLLPDTYQILGKLSDLYVEVSNFVIHPFVGWCDHLPVFDNNSTEVEKIILFPIQDFIESERLLLTQMPTITGVLEVPYYPHEEEIVWGATAMILSEFIEVAKLHRTAREPHCDSAYKLK